ncbi:hypothetical protein [Bacillus cereus]|nr:hypothetical protein [Bacillus cereus]
MVKVVRENQSGEIGEHNIDEGTIGKIVNVFVDEEPDNIYFEAGALILAE